MTFTTFSTRTTLALTLPLSLAALLALAACETEGSQRPGTTKSGSGKKSSPKSNAEWSSIAGAPGEEIVVEVEINGDDAEMIEGGEGIQKRVVRRRIVLDGAQPANAAGAAQRLIEVEGMPLGVAVICPDGAQVGPQGLPQGLPQGCATAPGSECQVLVFQGSAPQGLLGTQAPGGAQGIWTTVAPTTPTQPTAPTPPPVMLGVRMREVDPVLATHLGVTARHATVLEDVAEELNGHASGLRDHDVIVAVNGEPNAGPADIRRILRSKKPGDTIVFTVVRPAGKSDVTVTLEAFDHAKFLSATPARVGG